MNVIVISPDLVREVEARMNRNYMPPALKNMPHPNHQQQHQQQQQQHAMQQHQQPSSPPQQPQFHFVHSSTQSVNHTYPMQHQTHLPQLAMQQHQPDQQEFSNRANTFGNLNPTLQQHHHQHHYQQHHSQHQQQQQQYQHSNMMVGDPFADVGSMPTATLSGVASIVTGFAAPQPSPSINIGAPNAIASAAGAGVGCGGGGVGVGGGLGGVNSSAGSVCSNMLAANVRRFGGRQKLPTVQEVGEITNNRSKHTHTYTDMDTLHDIFDYQFLLFCLNHIRRFVCRIFRFRFPSSCTYDWTFRSMYRRTVVYAYLDLVGFVSIIVYVFAPIEKYRLIGRNVPNVHIIEYYTAMRTQQHTQHKFHNHTQSTRSFVHHTFPSPFPAPGHFFVFRLLASRFCCRATFCHTHRSLQSRSSSLGRITFHAPPDHRRFAARIRVAAERLRRYVCHCIRSCICDDAIECGQTVVVADCTAATRQFHQSARFVMKIRQDTSGHSQLHCAFPCLNAA